MSNKKIEELVSLLFNTPRTIREHTKAKNRLDVFSALRAETLRFIGQKNPTMKELADYLHITAPSVTKLTDGLFGKGYIKKQSGIEDKRITRLLLTKKGERTIKDSTEQSVKKLGMVFSKLSQKDIDSFIAILKKIRTICEEH